MEFLYHTHLFMIDIFLIFRASDYVEDDLFSNFEEDPIESAGLFEGDIDNVSMDDLQSMETRVGIMFFFLGFF